MLGRAVVVFLQELCLALGPDVPTLNPLFHVHCSLGVAPHQAILVCKSNNSASTTMTERADGGFQTRVKKPYRQNKKKTQACGQAQTKRNSASVQHLGYNTGILLHNTQWRMKEVNKHAHFTYVRVHIPKSKPSVGTNVRLLHLWSIHSLQSVDEAQGFWHTDAPNLSLLNPATMSATLHEAAIIGAGLNAICSPTLDCFLPYAPTQLLPTGLLAQAGLVDLYQVLNPIGTASTYVTVQGGILCLA